MAHENRAALAAYRQSVPLTRIGFNQISLEPKSRPGCMAAHGKKLADGVMDNPLGPDHPAVLEHGARWQRPYERENGHDKRGP
jgi:hypothetical protein